jgi:hypothetical protein
MMFPKVVRNNTGDALDDDLSKKGDDESFFGISGVSLNGESIKLPGDESVEECNSIIQRTDAILGGASKVHCRAAYPRFDSSLTDDDMSSIGNSLPHGGTQQSGYKFREVPSLLGGTSCVSLYGESTIQNRTVYYDDDDTSLGLNSINTTAYFAQAGNVGRTPRSVIDGVKAVASVETSVTNGDEEDDEGDASQQMVSIRGSTCCTPCVKSSLVVVVILLIIAIVMLAKGMLSSSSSAQSSSSTLVPTNPPSNAPTKKSTKAPKQQEGDDGKRRLSSSWRRYIRESTSRFPE